MTAGASAEAIRFHYDVGTDFYACWLGPTLTYSCALWSSDDRTQDDRELDSAQLRKLDYAVAQSGAAHQQRVLDIGCGWGSCLRRLVDQHGVAHAVGLTLSPDQARHVRAASHPDIRVEICSFEAHRPERPYDAAISIGAFEHFARPGMPVQVRVEGYRAFFRHCHRMLNSGARLYLQTMAYGDSETLTEGFLQRHIFPESDLPRLWEICQAFDRLFEVEALVAHPDHYERTVKAWDRALARQRSEVVARSSEDTYVRYRTYLRLAAIGFHQHTHTLLRMSLRRLAGGSD